VDVQEVPTVVFEFSAGLFGLYGIWHCHDEAVPLLPVGLDVFCELNPETSTEETEFTFHHASEYGLTVLHENSN
jgi:hypothetical protein